MQRSELPSLSLSVLHLPPSQPGGAPRDVHCAVAMGNGRRLTLESPEPLTLGLAVSVEHEDTLLLGEVVSCVEAHPSLWLVDLKLEQVLNGLHDLMMLRARLLEERPVPVERQPTR